MALGVLAGRVAYDLNRIDQRIGSSRRKATNWVIEAMRPLVARVADSRLAAITRLVESRIRKSDQYRAWQPCADVGLHLNDPTLKPDQCDRQRARRGHYPTARTCVSDGSSPGCSTTPTASSRMLEACIRCSRIHTAAS